MWKCLKESAWRPQVLINNDNQFIFSNWHNFKVFVIIHYAKHVLITSPYLWVFVTHWQQDISWAVHNNIQQRSIMLSFFFSGVLAAQILRIIICTVNIAEPEAALIRLFGRRVPKSFSNNILGRQLFPFYMR